MKWIFFILVCGWSVSAATTYYVDPNFGGAPTGSATQPFTNLNAAAWLLINNNLSNGPVTVYFSARAAGGDTNQYYDTAGNGSQLPIDLNQKTNNSGYLLTMDGSSYWNTNDAAPSWLAYSGSAKCVVQYFDSENSGHLKRSDITIHGFNILCNASTKIVTICGDNFTLENCDCSQTSAALDGPGVLIMPTADGAHGGSASYAPICTNINIIGNVIHDTEGEAVYIGGGGGPVDGSAGAGYPSHMNITIASNSISKAGEWGGQGDGIDIKGGLSNVVIVANNIFSLNYTGGIRAIVSQGQTNGATGTRLIIERNYIHDCNAISSAAIDIVDSWGTPQGVIIRNNILANIDGPGDVVGIAIATCQDQQLVENNTIYNCRGYGMGDGYSSSSVRWRNNLLINNHTNGSQVTYKATGTNDSDYNAYVGASWGFAGEGAHTISISATSLVNVATGDFRVATGSPLIDVGETQSGFSNDYIGTHRPQGAAWDIGAYEYLPLGLNTINVSGTANVGTLRSAQ